MIEIKLTRAGKVFKSSDRDRDRLREAAEDVRFIGLNTDNTERSQKLLDMAQDLDAVADDLDRAAPPKRERKPKVQPAA